MDSKESDDAESLKKTKEMIEKLNSELKASGASASTSTDLQNLSKEIQQLLMVTSTTTQDPTLRIHDGTIYHHLIQHLLDAVSLIMLFFLPLLMCGCLIFFLQSLTRCLLQRMLDTRATYAREI